MEKAKASEAKRRMDRGKKRRILVWEIYGGYRVSYATNIIHAG